MREVRKNLVAKIKQNSKKYAHYQSLLSPTIIKSYDYKMKYTIIYYFCFAEKTINMLQSNLFLPKITSTLKYKPNKFVRYKKDPVNKSIEKILDNKKITYEFYEAICKVAYSLTFNEAQYLIYHFIYHKELKEICEILDISSAKLFYIEKSCLIKIINKLKTTSLELFF